MDTKPILIFDRDSFYGKDLGIALNTPVHSAEMFETAVSALEQMDYRLLIMDPGRFEKPHPDNNWAHRLVGVAHSRDTPVMVFSTLPQKVLATDYQLREGSHYEAYAMKPTRAIEVLNMIAGIRMPATAKA